MAEEKKEKKKENRQSPFVLLAALLAVVIIIAAAAYHFGLFGAAEPKAPQTQSALDLPDAKLLLASMQNEVALTDVHMKYIDTEDGSPTTYDVKNNITDGWVLEQGDYGSFEGYFGQDNSSYYVCLTYQNLTKCAKTGTSPDAIMIANRLRTRLPDSRVSAANMNFAEKLIAIGAMRFSGVVVNETSGAYQAQKLQYVLDYRNITVQNLLAAGVQPNDPTIYSVANWTVSNWIDSKTGILVKSVTSYVQNGVPHTFSREVLAVETGNVSIPTKPMGLVSADAFVQFYQGAESDYTQRQGCMAMNESEMITCFKSLAANDGDGRICRLINDSVGRGQCLLVVAQTTGDASWCQEAGSLSDDCYIAVVSQTGNADLCSRIQNASLLQDCYAAKVSGDRVAAENKAEQERLAAGMNCKNDSDCLVAGNQNQYCVPKNSTGQVGNETSIEFECLAGVPCGCVDGYCQFEKQGNQNYSKCIDDVENQMTNDLIASFVKQAAANKTNSTGAAPAANATNSTG